MQLVKPMLFEEALAKLGLRSPIGSDLSSSEWQDVPVALRERAFFSSRVESVRFLDRAQGMLDDFLKGARETNAAGETMLKMGGRAQFVEMARGFAQAEGMGPLTPDDKGTVTDITSQKRLELIFDTQTRQAQDFGYWKQGQDPDVLDIYPAQRFIRDREVDEPRDLHVMEEGQVRLKSDLDYWLALNEDFGVPWGPWGWGCGHDVEDVDREEAEQLGLLQPGQAAQPVEKDFNDRLEASTRNLDPDLIQRLVDSFGDQIELEQAADGTVANVRWSNTKAAPAPKQPASAPPPAPATSSNATLQDVLKTCGLEDGETATADKILRVREELKETNPINISQVTSQIKGNTSTLFNSAALQQDAQAFADFIPAHKLKALPKLKIEAAPLAARGEYSEGSKSVTISTYIGDAAQRRRTMFHELMHWLHIEGDTGFKSEIKTHYQARTKGEQLVQLHPYTSRGKKDKWYEPYAGKVYGDAADPIGYEVPTRYIEWLVMPPTDAAYHWNDPVFRETMKIVLRALF